MDHQNSKKLFSLWKQIYFSLSLWRKYSFLIHFYFVCYQRKIWELAVRLFQICHKVFKCKAYLVPHLRTHVGEGRKRTNKRLSCILCRNEFTTQKRLQNHFVQKHPAVFKACPPSPSTFVRVQSTELAQMSLQNNSCERYERNFNAPFITFDWEYSMLFETVGISYKSMPSFTNPRWHQLVLKLL